MPEKPSGPQLLIAESAERTMTRAAANAYPNETGGVLVGVYGRDAPWVTLAVELHTHERGRFHYRLPGGATQAAITNARRVDARLGYLGDWHSHPSDSGPSPTDLASLSFISLRHPRTPNPTTVVVRRTPDGGYWLDARRIVHAKPRRCGILATGDLPATAPTDQEVSNEEG